MWIEAAADPSLIELAKWGPAGIVILGFVSGWLWAKPAVERLQKDLDRALADLREVRKEQRELEKAHQEIILPAILKFTEIGERIQDMMKNLTK